jgi:hypothetical protein
LHPPNEILWLLFVALDFSAALLVFRLFGRVGLYGLIVMNIIICNLQVMKIIELFGVTTTLGNILYASVFFATDLLSEKYGPREARRGVLVGFVMLILATVYMQVALLFQPHASDFIHPALTELFTVYPRVAAASLAAYLVSQLHDVWAFHYVKKRTSGKYLWLRNNVSTMISQGLDTVIFVFIAFWGVFPWPEFLQILATTYVVKFALAAADTPFIYLAVRFKTPDGAKPGQSA